MMADLMRRIPRRIVSVALTGLLVFVICLGILVSMHSAGARDDTQLPLNDDRSPLFGRWYLTSYWTEEGGAPVIEGTDVIIAFAGDGWVSGSSGCNLFIGEHDLADDVLTIRKIESTNMTSTPEVLNQEKAFLALLLKTEAYEIDGDRLRLFDASGMELLSFASQPQSLSGRAWSLWYSWNDTEESVRNHGSDLITLQISLQFPDEAQFRGTIADSDYCGTYESDEDRIQFESVEKCSKAPGEKTDLYEWYYSLLNRARGYRITETQLDIMDEKGHSFLSFTRMPLSLISADWYPQQYRAADGSALLSPEETFEMVYFTPDGNVFGTIRGIQFAAQYDTDNSSISFGPVSLLISESDDPGEARESRETIESIFRETRTYRVQNGTLEFSSGDGEVLMVMAEGSI
ncbi:META domain-containing protein [Methanoculleus palmolei]|jgi:heat shock protein HslJ|uniref:META domain-containing protein n=2 Tax=Methanoculleus TaxID=45989 RepID=A0ABD8AAH8_9EURY|nr:META domain-containing protein [Methanoculleus palmolei]